MFGKYPDVSNEAIVSTDNTDNTDKSVYKSKRKKKKEKNLKALIKAIRKNNKLLKQKIEQQKAEKEAFEKISAKQEGNTSRKAFFAKLGDAICKAVPAVLTAVATGIISHFFKLTPSKRLLRAG